MSRIYCPIFDTDLHKRKKYQPLCQVHRHNIQQCRKCKIEYYKINNPLLYKLIKGIEYFATKSSYYFNGQTIPNDGHIYLIQKAKQLLADI